MLRNCYIWVLADFGSGELTKLVAGSGWFLQMENNKFMYTPNTDMFKNILRTFEAEMLNIFTGKNIQHQPKNETFI